MTELKYAIISGVLALSLAIMTGVPMSHSRKTTDFFSASMGIIICTCVKSIFVDCGWGFASIFGTGVGLAVELTVMLASLAFFRELYRDSLWCVGSVPVAGIGALICFGTGRFLWQWSCASEDRVLFVAARATELALLLLSLWQLSSDEICKGISLFIRNSAAVTMLTVFLICVVDYLDGDFSAVALMTIGTSGMLAAFAVSARQKREISPSCFALGVMAALCLDSLTM